MLEVSVTLMKEESRITDTRMGEKGKCWKNPSAISENRLFVEIYLRWGRAETIEFVKLISSDPPCKDSIVQFTNILPFVRLSLY